MSTLNCIIGTSPTGRYIPGGRPTQVAANTGFTVTLNRSHRLNSRSPPGSAAIRIHGIRSLAYKPYIAKYLWLACVTIIPAGSDISRYLFTVHVILIFALLIFILWSIVQYFSSPNCTCLPSVTHHQLSVHVYTKKAKVVDDSPDGDQHQPIQALIGVTCPLTPPSTMCSSVLAPLTKVLATCIHHCQIFQNYSHNYYP